MNILMMTNTYKPLIGGLERSVEAFSKEFRERGHRVVVVAPEFPDMFPETDVVRIPAVQNFNGSDFSVQLPIPGVLSDALGDFKPDIVHTHHPFLIGDTALRVASKFNVPLVFTHHTLYEENVHYVPGDQQALKRFVIELSTGYANLTDTSVAPSGSVRDLMRERGVTAPIEVIPTGVYKDQFKRGAGRTFRRRLRIPADAFVIGHIGRLAPEKNLDFLMRCAVHFLKKEPNAHVLIAGRGPSEEAVQKTFMQAGLQDRLHVEGLLKGKDLVDAYHAMDAFMFASQSETQGLVLTEAMAAGRPVVAVDAPGVRDVVKDGINGRLILHESLEDFVSALQWTARLSSEARSKMIKACLKTADEFSMQNSIEKLLKLYTSLAIEGFVRRAHTQEHPLGTTMRLIHAQWEIIKNLTRATSAMVFETPVQS